MNGMDLAIMKQSSARPCQEHGGPRPVVVIRADGGHKRGMGHIFRMMTLSSLLAAEGVQVVFVSREDDVLKTLLASSGYRTRIFSRNVPEIDLIGKVLEETVGDVWIFDVLDTRPEWLRKVKSGGCRVVTLDDLEGGLQEGDMVVNAIKGCWSEQGANQPSWELLNGPRYAILDPRISRLRNRPKKGGILNLGLAMGGSDTYGATVRIMEHLTRTKMNFGLTVFTGPHFKFEVLLKNELDRCLTPARWIRAPKDLVGMLAGMDAVITGGGQTLFEVCALGKAVAALANEPHEEKTIGYFVRQGAAVSLGSIHSSIDAGSLNEFLDNFQKRMNLESVGRRAAGLVDGLGAFRVRDKCLGLLGRSAINGGIYETGRTAVGPGEFSPAAL